MTENAEIELKPIRIELKPVSKPLMFMLKLWGYCAVGVIALFALSFVVMILSVFYSMLI